MILELTGKQRRTLRSLGHHLEPVVHLGMAGVSPEVVQQVEVQLLAHELIKLKVGEGCPDAPGEVGNQLGETTGSLLVQVKGNTVLLYRSHPDRPRVLLV